MADRQTVLLVEDDDDLRRLYRHALLLGGYEVYEARGGFEALQRLDSLHPDIIVLDLMLPGVDGFTVRRELGDRAETRTIPIMVVTAAHGVSVESLDVTCMLTKPVPPERLVDEVRRCLASASQAGASPTG